MEFILYWIVVFIAGILFLPEYKGAEFRNVPLFIIIVIIAVILTVIKILRYIFSVLKIKKQLIENGYTVSSTSFLPNFKNSKCYHLSAQKDEKTVNVYIAKRKNSYVTYLFENENKAILYKHTRLTIKPEVRQAYIISPKVDTKKTSEVYFFWREDDFNDKTENILLFKKLPNNIKDTKTSIPLDNGDKINGKVLLFDIKGFLKYINN